MPLISLLTLKSNEKGVLIQLEGEDAPRRRTAAELGAYFNMDYTPGIACTHSTYELISSIQKSLKISEIIQNSNPELRQIKLNLEQYIRHQPEYLEIRWINRMSGYAPFALTNIPANTVIGILSGELISENERGHKDGSYCANAGYFEHKNNDYSFSIDCKKLGDVNRFTAHAPGQAKLKNLSLHNTIDPKQIVTANVRYDALVHNGIPVVVQIAKVHIPAGEIICEDYGDKYWERQRKPLLLVRNKQQPNLAQVALFDTKEFEYKLDKQLTVNLSPSIPIDDETALAIIESLKTSPTESKNIPANIKKYAFHLPAQQPETNNKSKEILSKNKIIDLKIPFSSKKDSNMPCEIINAYLDLETKSVVANTQQFGFFRENKWATLHKEFYLNLLCHAIIKGDFNKAQEILSNNKDLLEYLLLTKYTVTDFSGRTIRGYALQLALGAEDIDMIEMIQPFFNLAFPHQEIANKEISKQYAEQFPLGYEHAQERIFNRNNAALLEIYDIIFSNENAADCEKGLNLFRKHINQTATIQTGKHFDIKLLMHAWSLYSTLCNIYNEESEEYGSVILFRRKVVGYLQRFTTACTAQAICQGIHKLNSGDKLQRSLYSSAKDNTFYPLDLFYRFRLGYDYAESLDGIKKLHQRKSTFLQNGINKARLLLDENINPSKEHHSPQYKTP